MRKYPISILWIINLFKYCLFKVDGLEGNAKVRGVNLGGWLVVEGWIKPSLFAGIPNGDMLVSFLIFIYGFLLIYTL